jgi:aspartyl-tRNA synthetase
MPESMGNWKRTMYCGDLRMEQVGQEVVLCGWVQRQRDKGGLIFVDLRDRTGICQITVDADSAEEVKAKAKSLRMEYCICVKGKVLERASKNPNIPTGDVEVYATGMKILSESETPPFMIEENSKANDALRLTYRYLDLRRPDIQKNIMMRHQVTKLCRDYFDRHGFLEIETPMLIKSTPEGARDYIVPSRVHPGSFYALPQSPQLYKQLLMLSGYDRYMQIVRCFRDEDLRADRQPEFTQIDLEMSFVDAEDVMTVNEGFIKELFQKVLGVEVQTPFLRMPWKESMERFGNDKPDMRFGFELKNVSDLVKDCGFGVFSGAIANGGAVRGINVNGYADKFSRKEIDSLGEYVKGFGAKGLAWIKVNKDGVQSPIAKFFKEEEMAALLQRMEAKENDLLLFVADKESVVFAALAELRQECARRLGLLDPNDYKFLWVTEFPVFEYSEEEDRYMAKHHPFTAPMDEDIDMLETDKANARAKAYDIVLNGVEIGGGSVRIHQSDVQQKMFSALGFTQEEAMEKFGFLINAFRYGTPPHAGMAYGLDRLVMLMAHCDSIRDVIAFPKVQNASELMSKAPDVVDEKQLKELGIAITQVEK